MLSNAKRFDQKKLKIFNVPKNKRTTINVAKLVIKAAKTVRAPTKKRSYISHHKDAIEVSMNGRGLVSMYQ
jgi:hypothetical protein